jgi:hypothetical protein
MCKFDGTGVHVSSPYEPVFVHVFVRFPYLVIQVLLSKKKRQQLPSIESIDGDVHICICICSVV